jgi:hypothetical protein
MKYQMLRLAAFIFLCLPSLCVGARPNKKPPFLRPHNLQLWQACCRHSKHMIHVTVTNVTGNAHEYERKPKPKGRKWDGSSSSSKEIEPPRRQERQEEPREKRRNRE